MKLAKKLASVPLEYQASVYAKESKLLRQKKQERNREILLKLRSQLKVLKEQLKTTLSEEMRTKIFKEMAVLEKSIKKTPRAKKQWSLILSGSFETGKK